MSSAEPIQTGDARTGVISEAELQFLRDVRELVRATIDGQVSFVDAVQNLSGALKGIQKHGLDVAAAAASGSIGPLCGTTRSGPEPAPPSPTEAERNFLEDVDGMIDYAVTNGVSFWTVLKQLAHDVGGLAAYGWNLDRATSDFFLPMATGWAQRNAERAGQADEMA